MNELGRMGENGVRPCIMVGAPTNHCDTLVAFAAGYYSQKALPSPDRRDAVAPHPLIELCLAVVHPLAEMVVPLINAHVLYHAQGAKVRGDMALRYFDRPQT